MRHGGRGNLLRCRMVAIARRRPWTPEEDAIIRQRFSHEPTAPIAATLARSQAAIYQRAYALGLKKSAAYLASPQSGRTGHDDRGKGGWFPKGHVPYNKGIPHRKGWAPGRMAAHQFKKGCRQGIAAKNWMPVGTINLVDGYLRIKVREARSGEAYGYGNTKVWLLLQRHVWEQANGPVPAGYVVVFKDRNPQNCALDNLELVSRRDLMLRNSVHNLPKPIAQAIQLLGALNRQIRKRERHGNQEQNR